jgi:cytochrome c oxidase subunit II
MLKQSFLAVALFAIIAFDSNPGTTVQAAPPQDSKVIAITAKRFAFTPDHIVLKRGEPVTLRLTSEDVTHGFFVRALKADELIEPGKTVDIKVNPDTAGTFTVICHHFCGAGHGNMKMTITVE